MALSSLPSHPDAQPANLSLAGEPRLVADSLLPDQVAIEIAFTADVWTDVTDMVRLEQGVRITHPPCRPGEVGSPSVLELTLTNCPDDAGIAHFTPDNPLSQYYPNVVRDRMIRVRVVRGDNTWYRFKGWIDRWVPDSGSGELNTQVTHVSATCIRAKYNRKVLQAEYTEGLLHSAATDTPPRAIDMWPLDDGAAPKVVRNVGFDATGARTPALPAKVVQAARSATGQIAFGQPDGGLLTEGEATFTRASDGTASCPVLKCHLQRSNAVSRVSFWAKLESGWVYDDAIAGFDSRGNCLWRFGPTDVPVSGRWDWAVKSPSDNDPILVVNVGNAGDGAWRWYSLLFGEDGAGVPTIDVAVRTRTIPDLIVGSVTVGVDTAGRQLDARLTRYLSVGGYMPPNHEGIVVNSFMGSVSGLYVMHGEYGDQSFSGYASPDTVLTADAMRTHFAYLALTMDTMVGGSYNSAGTDSTLVSWTESNGRTLLDVWSELATTTGSILATLPDGRRYWRRGVDCRPTTVTIHLDVELDLQGGPVWEHVERPTRVTASSPGGSATIIDEETELSTGGVTADASISTCASTADGAAQVAASIVRRNQRLRLSRAAVDLTLSATDRWASIMALVPGDRGRLGGLPVGLYGATYVDWYVDGWVETYTPDSVLFVFDTQAADDPSNAITDSATYGRVAADAGSTVTSGTCVGATGTGTIVITTTGTPWTVDAADYPMDLDWNGERLTVNTAPASPTSPQTMTVTSRGVAPTGARIHAADEAIDMWLSAPVAF